MTRPTPISSFGLRDLEVIAGTKIDTANAKSALAGLDSYGYAKLGLNKPHRLAHFMAQTMHESGRYRYDREIWGPTPAQKRYDTRTDLGNTAARDGDGERYKGRAGIQITGKSNYQQFTAWCKKRFTNAPDFVKNPDLVNTDPWEGLAALWYWETRELNAQADANDLRQVTRKINGGYNGLDDRYKLYDRSALHLLGYGPNEITRFQMDNGLTVDGVSGAKTRAALHRNLLLTKPLGGQGNFSAPAEKPAASTLQKPSSYGIIAVIGGLIAWAISYFTGG
jgi:putative chitinase